MAIETLGAGAKLTARLITMDYGTPKKPWIVFKSDDAGIWPIESHATEDEAEASAGRLNLAEDQRCDAINEDRAARNKPPLSRGIFDDYFVRHRSDPKAPI